jgi:maltodextrin utilization protein YvdJ
MDKESYRFIVNCLGWSIVLIVIAGIILAFLQLNPGQLVPILAPIGTLLAGLLVVPPTSRG